MGRLRFCILLLAVVVCGSCRTYNRSVVRSVEVADIEWAEGVGQGVPERVLLAVDIDNEGSAAVMRKGRVRISYKGRRVMLFTLDERVRIPRHYDGIIEVPLRVNMAHNSQALAFRGALLRHDAAEMSVDWEVAGRAGVVGARIVQPVEPLAEVLSEPMLSTLWRITDACIGGAAAEE